MPAKTKERELWNLVSKFVKDNQISCPEAVAQSDHVIVNAYVFIEKCCDIVGYFEYPDEGT
jgi:hypothetical protein